MASRGLFRRLAQVAVVATASSVVLVSGVGSAFATTTTPPDNSLGNAGTSGIATQPQPLSTADQNTGGANGGCLTDPTGIYCSTRDGSPSGNGNQDTGQHTGEPCAGCVGKADNKNPPGQETTDPLAIFPNNGYECDNNNGIGQTNPAHTGCQPALVATCISAVNGGGVTWTLANDNSFAVTAEWTSGSQSGSVTIPAATPIDNKSSAPGTVTFTTTGTSVKVTFPGSSFTEIDKTADCPPPAPQLAPLTLTGLCVADTTPTWTLANSNDSAVPATWTTTSPAASGDVIAPAKDSVQFTTTATSVTVTFATGSGLAPLSKSMEACPPPAPTQTLAGHIYDCTGGTATETEVTGGTLAATGDTTGHVVGPVANPMHKTEVPADTYTMTGTAPNGYVFVACGVPTTTPNQTSVVVPPAGAGVGILYVAPVVVTQPTQTLAGDIYDCTGGTATKTEVTGGTLAATGTTTTTTLPATANPLVPTPVPADTYTMTGTAPNGYVFVACGVDTTTPNQTSVVVPSGGSGSGILYVAPVVVTPPRQTLSGVIDLCSGDMAPTAGSLLTIESTGVSSINPLSPPREVAAGGQTVDAIAPSGYHFIDCHDTTQHINTPTTATETVNVPPGGTIQAVFYVEKNETAGTPPLSLTVVKTNDADADGAFHDTETASAPAKAVTFQVQIVNNSTVALVIDSVVDAWSSSTANECANLLGTTLAAGHTATCTFTLAAYSPAAGGTLPDTVTVIGHQLDNPGNTTSGQDTSTVLTPTTPTTPTTPAAPDLSIVKTASAAGVTVGDTLTYTLVVTNVGAGATTGTVTVTDTVPTGLALGAITAADWSCGAAGLAITCTYNGGAIAAGQTVGGITVATTVLASAPTVVTNTGVVKTPGDTNPTNDTSTVKTPVTQVLGEKIPRTPGTTPGTPGTPGAPQVPTEIPTVAPTALPMTGTGVTALLPSAMGMLAAGLLLVVAGRRRRRT